MITRIKPIIFARKLAGINLANLPKPTSSERESICLSGEALGRFSAKGFLHELKLLRRDAGGIGIGRFNECLDRGWNKNWFTPRCKDREIKGKGPDGVFNGFLEGAIFFASWKSKGLRGTYVSSWHPYARRFHPGRRN
jgi:hypothetical protein